MIGIYKITNPKGKVYIGQSVDIHKRFGQYKKLQNCIQQRKLYNSLTKYCASEHKFELVEKCTVDQLNERERYWQEYYDTINNGLNCKATNTRDKSGHLCSETRHNISKSLKKLYNTPRGKEIRSKQAANRDQQAISKKVVENTDYDKRRANTDYAAIHKKRLVTRNEEARARKAWIAVYQVSKDGTLIREWPSIKEAGNSLGIQTNSISACCRTKRKTAGGFTWKYKGKV